MTNAGTIPDRGLFGVYLVGRRRPRRRAGRGDGLRGPRGPDVPARRVDLADRGDHARPRARLAGARGPRRRAVLEGRGHRPPVRARRGDRRDGPRARRARRRDARSRACARSTRSTRAPPRTSSPTCASRRRRPARSRPTGRSSSSASATRSATGASASSRRSARRVHAPWSLALAARLRDALGLEVSSIWSDDGIALHLPDADAPPADRGSPRRPGRARRPRRRRARRARRSSARASARTPRRALLIPRRRPGPADAALAAAAEGAVAPPGRPPLRRLPGRPRDLSRVPAGRLRPARRCGGCSATSRRGASISSTSRRRPPRRSRRSLLFDYVATYMYEDDTPMAERRAQALALDRDLLKELLGPGGAPRPPRRRRGRAGRGRAARRAALAGRAPRPPASARRPALRASTTTRSRRRSSTERRAVLVRVGGEDRLIAAEDAGRYRDALGAMPPAGLPDAFLEAGEAPLASLLVRYARGRGPFTTAEVAERFALAARACEEELGALERDGRLVRGELRPGGTEREWCDPDVLRRLRRASLAAAAQAGRAGRASRARALPAGLAGHRPAREPARGARPAPGPLAPGRALGVGPPAAARARLPARRSSTSSAPRARSSGSAPGSSGSPSTSARTRPLSAGPGRCRRPRARRTRRSARRSSEGALFWYDLSAETGLEAAVALPALWDLVWAGEVTNDAWQPLRASRRFADAAGRSGGSGASRGSARTRSRRRRAAGRPPARLFAGEVDPRALAELLLERQGIVTRDGVRAEGVPGGYGRVYQELRKLETLGVCRRGYFVEGLGGAQFALPGAVERLREQDGRGRDARACRRRSRPAVRRRASLAEARGGARRPRRGRARDPPRRRGGALRRARRPLARPAPRPRGGVAPPGARRARRARPRGAGRKRLAVERFDGEPVAESAVMPLLVEAGFLAGPRRAVLRA